MRFSISCMNQIADRVAFAKQGVSNCIPVLVLQRSRIRVPERLQPERYCARSAHSFIGVFL